MHAHSTHLSELVFAFRHGWMLLAGGLGGATVSAAAGTASRNRDRRERLLRVAFIAGATGIIVFGLYYWSL
jgi:hypothetical protein